MLTVIDREIEFAGHLDREQRERLTEIANRCPVHRTLSSPIEIRTRLLEIAP
jgi:putative redox protein